MGLFDIIEDVVGTLGDMKDLGKIQDSIEDAVKKLIDEGKCPAQLKTAYEELKSVSKDDSSTASMTKMINFAKNLDAVKDVLPDNIKSEADKYLKLAEDLKKKSEDITKQTSK